MQGDLALVPDARRELPTDQIGQAHVRRLSAITILAKLGLRDRVQAVILGYQTGLVSIDTA